MVNTVLVLGGGSAGLLAAATLKRRLPVLDVVVVRSPDIGVIGVGEGTTPAVTRHLHTYLEVEPNAFHRIAAPTPKLGIRLVWGKRPSFDYAFVQGMDTHDPGLPKPTGYLADEDMADFSPGAALMNHGRAFRRGADGGPVLDGTYAYHLENATFVGWLERLCAAAGVRVIDGTVAGVERLPAGSGEGVASVTLAGGQRLSADLFIDASGFRSVLLREALGEPTVDYASTLWCDRAVIGGWDRRPGEPIRPYTTVETMSAGWSWQIDHETRVNRGYVYCSRHASDDAAEAEFRRANPALTTTRSVRFASGRRARAWVGNVVGIGNAYGFVEPLEATSLGAICTAAGNLATALVDGDRVLRDGHRSIYNASQAAGFDAVRWFLGLHYRFNDRLDTPFWRACRGEAGGDKVPAAAADAAGVDVSGVQPIIDYYRDVGPSALFRTTLLSPNDPFGVEGYLVLLLGQRVPYRRTYHPSPADRAAWANLRAGFRAEAARGLTVEEALGRSRQAAFDWRRASYGNAEVSPADLTTAVA